ncbi:MAG: hypothetical protein ACJA2G_002093 [Cognaticolwellia sp.]|jgi:hypothetical protein
MLPHHDSAYEIYLSATGAIFQAKKLALYRENRAK